MRALPWLAAFAVATAGLACAPTHVIPAEPTWADAAPLLRGSCGSCHGWSAGARVCSGFADPQSEPGCASWPGGERFGTGGGFRFDFYGVDDLAKVCGSDVAAALDPNVRLAGSPEVAAQIAADIVPQAGARWPRMPPQPSPALPDWAVETLSLWAARPAKGPAPATNRPPTVAVSGYPGSADRRLSFTTIAEDPDGDSVVGYVEVQGRRALIDRPGSFAVELDASSWPAGTVNPTAVLCDGWTRFTYDLGPVEIRH